MAFITVLLWSGCIGAPEEDLPYQKIIDLTVAEGIPGVVLLVRTPDFEFIGVSGCADVENKIPMDKTQLFRIASTSKMFIGVLSVMLHCEGVITLDDPITHWLPPSITDRIQFAHSTTVRQLLNHTSGIYDYSENKEFWNRITANPTNQWGAEDVLVYVYGQPAYFEPGTNWYYSNTNYILAGLILDNALGYHHSRAIRTKILEPLNMTSTFYEHHEDIRGDYVHGYSDIDRDGVLDEVKINQGYGLADCGIVSTVEDCAVFIEFLLKEGFLDAENKNKFMKELLPQNDEFYGLGIMKYPTEYGTGYGNGGHFIGYESSVIYFSDHDVTIVYFANGTGPHLDRVMDDLLDRILKKTFSELKEFNTFQITLLPPRYSCPQIRYQFFVIKDREETILNDITECDRELSRFRGMKNFNLFEYHFFKINVIKGNILLHV